MTVFGNRHHALKTVLAMAALTLLVARSSVHAAGRIIP